MGAELADTLFVQTADLAEGAGGLETANGVPLSWWGERGALDRWQSVP